MNVTFVVNLNAILVKNNLYSFFSIFIPVIILTCISGCSKDSDKPDISEIQLTVNADRFERDLFNLNSKPEGKGIVFLKEKYGNFFNLFAYQITSLGSGDSVLIEERFRSFINDSNFRAIYNDCEKLFGNFDEKNEDLTKAFRYYKYYFPEKSIPRIVTMVSGFSYPVVCDSFILGISLDMYLNPSYRYYSTIEPALPNYLRSRMHGNFMVCDAMKGWAASDYSIDESSAKMIDFMILQGRLLFFLDKITPDEPDTIKSGYSSSQLEWCRMNEKQIWSFFIDNKLLFSFDPNLMNKYVNDGPTTNGFPKESPGNIGQYIGWQIVKSYMKNHPDVTLQKLMEEKDLLKIFNESKYKPLK